MRALLAADEAVTSEAAGAAHVENFALKVFMSADNDDRAGVTGKCVNLPEWIMTPVDRQSYHPQIRRGRSVHRGFAVFREWHDRGGEYLITIM